MISPLFLLNSLDLLAGRHAESALDTLVCINSSGSKLVTGSYIIGLNNSVYGTLSFTKSTTDTLVLVNNVRHKVLTYLSGTLLVYYVSNILVSEGLES